MEYYLHTLLGPFFINPILAFIVVLYNKSV